MARFKGGKPIYHEKGEEGEKVINLKTRKLQGEWQSPRKKRKGGTPLTQFHFEKRGGV